ncbi:MAG: class I SAM-dependent methyltransferase [Phormidium sp. GEM2.Bin31]|nr:MAG: class I SAM-dependent methyltransferase [Phormidium sp. GEM2.Bin31]
MPLMTASSNPDLVAAIREQILHSREQRLSFADYMAAALYHPQQGYYARGAKLGASGDFVTSSHLSADFGELLAEQFIEIWTFLGCPKHFDLVEMGAGQGILAVDILRYINKNKPEFFQVLTYIIIEKSAVLRQQQQQIQGANLCWKTWDDIAAESLEGCLFSNELVDAFPVHRLKREQGQWRECYVSWDEASGFQETLGPLSTPALATYFEQVGVNAEEFPDGYTTEVNLAALSWLETLARKLKRGYVITIDYGYEAQRYYHPQRSRGTLQCYRQHRHHDDPYSFVGEQDITAHVDFTALQRQGDRCGLDYEGFTPQALFLMALGLGDRLAALGQGNQVATGADIVRVMQRREVLHGLFDPQGLGGFGVLVQSKGLAADRPPLKGLTTPRMS